RVELLRTLLPRVRQRDDVVDLHRGRGVLSAGECDRRAGVHVVQGSRRDDAVAGTGPVDDVDEVAPQDVVAGVAAVAPELHRHVVAPRLTEQVAAVPGLGRAPL